MNHQRIYIIFFVFVALICQIYISAAPILPAIGDGVAAEKLPNNEPLLPVPDPVLLQSTIYVAPTPPAIGDGLVSMILSPTTTTTPKSNASNTVILQTALFAFIVIQMF